MAVTATTTAPPSTPTPTTVASSSAADNKKNYEKNKLDALVCLGGGGTAKNAKRLSDAGMNVITLPKTDPPTKLIAQPLTEGTGNKVTAKDVIAVHYVAMSWKTGKVIEDKTSDIDGGLLSSTMPLSGVMNTVVEKFVSDTIGLARTEQIGAYKNTSVGHTMTVHVGKEFLINCGKSKFVMDSDGNVTIIGTKFNFSASGNVQINGKIVDLN